MKKTIDLFTIGFTKKNARQFFELLSKAKIRLIIDTRLNNTSQLAGFTKRSDLEYFLKTIGNIDYVHILDFAPTKDILDEYKKKKGSWEDYEKKFIKLMNERKIEKKISTDRLNLSCLLCSEAKPHNCHRRLVAEYLNQKLGNINISHL